MRTLIAQTIQASDTLTVCMACALKNHIAILNCQEESIETSVYMILAKVIMNVLMSIQRRCIALREDVQLVLIAAKVIMILNGNTINV
jgi:hypothetical protein